VQALLDRILTFNLIGTTVVCYVAAKLYVLPRLETLRARNVLLPILLLHSLRHLGLMFLTRGAVYAGMPPQFAYLAAFGAVLAALLAFVCIPVVANGWKISWPMVWVFNVFGTLHLLAATTLANVYQAPVFMDPA
jgi:hypothetical protein